MTKSFGESIQSAAARTSGRCRSTQRSLLTTLRGPSVIAGAPGSARRTASAVGSQRGSYQSIAGPHGSPPASASTSVRICPDSETAATSSGRNAPASPAPTRAHPASQSSGSCSASPAAPSAVGCPARARASTRPSAVAATALTLPVPTSIPTTTSGMAIRAAVRSAVSARNSNARLAASTQVVPSTSNSGLTSLRS